MSRWLRIGFGVGLIILAIGLYVMAKFSDPNEAQGEPIVFVAPGPLIGLAAAATGFIDIDASDARLKSEFDAIAYASCKPADADTPETAPKQET